MGRRRRRRSVPSVHIIDAFGMHFSGQVAAGEAREYGKAEVSKIKANEVAARELLGKLPDSTTIWMSHGDKLTAVPEVNMYPFVFPREHVEAVPLWTFWDQPRSLSVAHKLSRYLFPFSYCSSF